MKSRECGSGSVLMLMACMVVVLMTAAVALVFQIQEARATAAKSADAAALAAAQRLLEGQTLACAQAEQLAIRNGGLMISCMTKDTDAQVTVMVRLHGFLAHLGPMKQTARARLTWRSG